MKIQRPRVFGRSSAVVYAAVVVAALFTVAVSAQAPSQASANRVLAKIDEMLSPFGVDVVGVSGGVDLDVRHAIGCEGGDLGFDDVGDVPEQFGAVGVELIRNARLKAQGRELVGAGYGHFECTR